MGVDRRVGGVEESCGLGLRESDRGGWTESLGRSANGGRESDRGGWSESLRRRANGGRGGRGGGGAPSAFFRFPVAMVRPFRSARVGDCFFLPGPPELICFTGGESSFSRFEHFD